MTMLATVLARFNLKAVLIILALLGFFVGLSIPFYLNLQRSGLRAEAKIMLGYIATLQEAHYTDTGRFVAFEEFYGSAIDGRENCNRPEGAVELGFSLNGCNRDPNKGGLRYAYRIVPIVDPETQKPDLTYGYRAEAVSGSDVSGIDFVCGTANRKDEWEVSRGKEPIQMKDCN